MRVDICPPKTILNDVQRPFEEKSQKRASFLNVRNIHAFLVVY